MHNRGENVYNSIMNYRTRYAKIEISREQFLKMRLDFMKEAGPSMQLLMDLME